EVGELVEVEPAALVDPVVRGAAGREPAAPAGQRPARALVRELRVRDARLSLGLELTVDVHADVPVAVVARGDVGPPTGDHRARSADMRDVGVADALLPVGPRSLAGAAGVLVAAEAPLLEDPAVGAAAPAELVAPGDVPDRLVDVL